MISYEWTVEETDEFGDVTDTAAYDSFAQARRAAGPRDSICLVRHTFDSVQSLSDRQWAYLESGKLPRAFDGGAPIPSRFYREISAT